MLYIALGCCSILLRPAVLNFDLFPKKTEKRIPYEIVPLHSISRYYLDHDNKGWNVRHRLFVNSGLYEKSKKLVIFIEFLSIESGGTLPARELFLPS